MPIVEAKVQIPGADLRSVWDTVIDFERYPVTMSDVLSVRFVDRVGSSATSEWAVLLNGSELTWIERDDFEPYERIVFEQIEGDLEVFRGSWLLHEDGEGVTVTLAIEFDVGIPSLAPVLDPIGIQAIKRNCRSMLTAIHRTAV